MPRRPCLTPVNPYQSHAPAKSAPALLGQGEALFHGLDLRGLGYSVTGREMSDYATHLTLEKG